MSAVDQKADGAEQQIRRPDHQVNALVIGAGLAHRVVFILRTGGTDGLLSRGAGAGGTRESQRGEER